MKEVKLYGNVKIKGTLDPRTGDYWFDVSFENSIKSARRKCLYDALSDFGISYDKAKEIMLDYHAVFGKVVTFDTVLGDYHKDSRINNMSAKNIKNDE